MSYSRGLKLVGDVKKYDAVRPSKCATCLHAQRGPQAPVSEESVLSSYATFEI